MSNLVEVKVPDIGDFKNVPVIEVLVGPGDTVNREDSLTESQSRGQGFPRRARALAGSRGWRERSAKGRGRCDARGCAGATTCRCPQPSSRTIKRRGKH
jgi:hypothetical protein